MHHQYSIGNELWSLIDIYQGVLRGNRAIGGKSPLFSDSDRRILYVATELDPRVHFLVNFQASSCPRITVFTSNHKNEMKYAIKSYLKKELRFVPQTSEVSKKKRYKKKLFFLYLISWFFSGCIASNYKKVQN